MLLANLLASTALLGAVHGTDDVKVSLERYAGPAKVTATSLEKFKLRLDVDRQGETQPLTLRVELPASGPKTWPAADVEVRGASGEAMLVQRSGIEWEKLLISLPPDVTTCFVQAVEPPTGWPVTTSEKDRVIHDATSAACSRRRMRSRWQVR